MYKKINKGKEKISLQNTQTHLPCHEITKKILNGYIIHILSRVEDIQNKWIAKQIRSVRSRYMEKNTYFFISQTKQMNRLKIRGIWPVITCETRIDTPNRKMILPI